MVDIANVEDLALDFTIPGYDIELRVCDSLILEVSVIHWQQSLKPGGREIQVTSDNVDEYIHDVLDAIIGKGAQPQAKAFREGFSKVFPVSDLQSFSADELVMLFGNADEDWSIESRHFYFLSM
jgi:E3 ubiquitin-protein ligase TRIP12